MKRTAIAGMSLLALLTSYSCESDGKKTRIPNPPALSDTLNNAVYTYSISDISPFTKPDKSITGYRFTVKFDNDGDSAKYFSLRTVKTDEGEKTTYCPGLVAPNPCAPILVEPSSSRIADYTISGSAAPKGIGKHLAYHERLTTAEIDKYIARQDSLSKVYKSD